ncbi:MAG: hypothetical protein ACE5IY_04995 [bacterium]
MTVISERPGSGVVRIISQEEERAEPRIRIGLLAEGKNEAVYGLLKRLREDMPYFRNVRLTRSLSAAHYLILHVLSEAWGWKAMRAIKSRPALFLKPILLLHECEATSLAGVVDEALPWPVSYTLFEEIVHNKFAHMTEKLDSLVELPKSLGELGLKKVLVLRFLYSRPNSVLEPVRDRCAKVGYSYPLVRLLFQVRAGVELEHLESLQEATVLSAKLVDRVNVCPHCEHTQINFRELCPHCNSLNINEEATVHHFRCAFVGRESEFARGEKLICPKCHNELRHIGVDYDKPSEVLWCGDCGHNFSDPRLSCFCLACATTFAPEEALVKQISAYTLAQEGYRAAEEGVLPGFGLINILKKELGFYKREVFLDYLQLEVARCKRYRVPSTLSKFELQSIRDSLGETLVIHSRQFRRAFADVVRQTYRKTDLFTDLPNGDILILFLNTSPERTQIAYKRLAERLEKTFRVRVPLRFALYDLTKVEDTQILWERLQDDGGRS